jgi:GNAT superfamily N-acetyltransferase
METQNPGFRIERILEVNDTFIEQISREMDEGTKWDHEQGELFLKNKDNALFAAFVGDELIGYVYAQRLQRFDARKAEVLIYEISVNENHREKGIGKALIKTVNTWAKEVGADESWVLTYSSNIPAMALYKSAGGVEDEPGTRMFTYKI